MKFNFVAMCFIINIKSSFVDGGGESDLTINEDEDLPLVNKKCVSSYSKQNEKCY